MEKRELDRLTNTETTGHVWDGIKELDTPTPYGLTIALWVMIIIALGISVLFPSWPTINSHWKGTLNSSLRENVEKEYLEFRKISSTFTNQISDLEYDEIISNITLMESVDEYGKILFKENCAACHGQAGSGNYGYPQLSDNAWIWGGSLETIEETITYGIRDTENEDTRESEMTTFDSETINTTDVGKITNYIIELANGGKPTLSAPEIEEGIEATGAQLYLENCASCHAVDGSGDVEEFGAPALNDNIWIYGGKKEQIISQIRNPQHGVMPSWQDKLSPEEIKTLTIYVHGLGGGE